MTIALFVLPPPGRTAGAPNLKNVATPLGTVYCVDQDFIPTLDARAAAITAKVRDARAKGSFTGYISVPISPAGGGNTGINKSVSADIKSYLEEKYSHRVWLLSPGSEDELPQVNGKSPGGAEYMYMWTQVLAGDDAKGRDFDFFYFAGRSDFWRTLKIASEETSIPTLESLADKQGLSGDARRQFVAYYAFRSSATVSKGSHDEWNILRRINSLRRADKAFGAGAQIASLFDGRPVDLASVETEASAGYEGACH